MTSRSSPTAAPAPFMPAGLPTSSASRPSSSRPWPGCSAPSACSSRAPSSTRSARASSTSTPPTRRPSRRFSTRWRRCSRRHSLVAKRPCWAPHRRPSLRRPELGGRGPAARRAGRPGFSHRPARAIRGRARGALRRARPAGLAGRTCAPCGSRRSAPASATPSFDVDDALVPDRLATRRMWLGGRRPTCRCGRARRSARTPRPGRCLVDEYDTTVVVPAGWTRAAPPRDGNARAREGEPVAEQSRRRPIRSRSRSSRTRSSRSPTRWRRRSSARRTRPSSATGWTSRRRSATPQGETVAQAVSVPFHLGSIPTAMASLLGHYGDRVRPGDVFIMNDPFDGGMHLQDIFVVKPVHLDGGADRLGRHDRPPRRRRRTPARARAPATTRRSSRRGCACPGSGSTPRASRSRRCTS